MADGYALASATGQNKILAAIRRLAPGAQKDYT